MANCSQDTLYYSTLKWYMCTLYFGREVQEKESHFKLLKNLKFLQKQPQCLNGLTESGTKALKGEADIYLTVGKFHYNLHKNILPKTLLQDGYSETLKIDFSKLLGQSKTEA